MEHLEFWLLKCVLTLIWVILNSLTFCNVTFAPNTEFSIQVIIGKSMATSEKLIFWENKIGKLCQRYVNNH